jgi:hypothetical protein
LVRDTWETVAKKIGIQLKAYAKSKDIELNNFDKNTPFFIDHDLINESGLDVAKNFIKLGYFNVSLATGHKKAIHPSISQIGKEFPIC